MAHELSSQLTGIDTSKETSLFEYGLLIAPYTKDGQTDEYFCVYSLGNGMFDTGYKRENEINELIKGNEWASAQDIDSFLSFVGMNITEWLEMPMIHKLHDCLNYWGYQEIMGDGYIGSAFSEEKARELYF